MTLPQFHGVIPPMVTPLLARAELDEPGLERLIEHLIAGGVNALFLLGTTGEGPSLPYSLRRRLLERACRQIAGRVPVLVGITDTVFEESIAVALHAAEQGASAVVLAPPYYLSASQPELLHYVGAIVAQLPLPLLVYNIPVLTKVAFEPETVQKMAQFERVVGVKDSSGSIPYLRKIIACLSQRPDWSLLTGRDDLLAEAIRLGGHGGVCGGANVFPRLFVTLAKAVREGDLNLVASLEAQVTAVGAKLYTVGRDMPGFIKGIKCALACLGICDDAMAGPLLRFDAAERQLIAERVSQLESDLAGIVSD